MKIWYILWLAVCVGEGDLAVQAMQAASLPSSSNAQPGIDAAAEDMDRFPLDATGVERSIQNVPFSMTTLTLAPYSKVRPGRVFGIRCRIVNEQAESDTVTVVAHLAGRPGEQYARKVTIDGGRSRTLDVHLPVPANYSESFVEVSCTLWVERNGRSIFIDRDGEAIEQKLRLPVDQQTCITASLLNDPPREYLAWEWPRETSYPSYDWLVATRVEAGFQRLSLDLQENSLPNEIVDWDSIDNLVIANERIFHNYPAMMSLKAWLMSGGRAWVMLDHVDVNLVRPLLLSGQYVHFLDETELTAAVLDSSMTFNEEERNYKFTSQRGVRLVKVEQRGGEVTHTADGWPAAIWMPIGDGELLLTTLGAPAWLQPTKSNEGRAELSRSEFEQRPWVGPMGDRFHQNKVPPMEEQASLGYPVAKVGFKVLGREIVAMSLLSFCGLLGIVGCWLRFSKKPEWIGWAAPVLSLGVGCGLAYGAGMLRSDVPEGWHRIQLIHSDGKDRLYVYEQSAMYRSQPTDYPLRVQSDARIDPEVGVSTRDFRVTELGLGTSVISSEGWPTGIWRMESQISTQADIAAATGIWTKTGLQIELPKELSALESLLISQPRAPRSVLKKDSDGKWQVLEDSTLPPNEYASSAGLIDDRFFHRADLLTKSFAPLGREARPKSLQVMGWGQTAAGGVAWDEAGEFMAGNGDALWRIPLICSPPEVNREVLIPPPLIRWDTVSTDVGASGAFLRSTGEWKGPFTNAMSTGVKPQLPDEVFPWRSGKIRLVSRIRAAGRNVIVYARTKEGKRELGSYFSPQQVIRLEISDPKLLQALNDQEFDLIVEVGELREKQDAKSGIVQAVPWQIEYLWMTVEGVANYLEKP